MGTPYLGEIRITAFQFAPKGWAFCNGQTLAITSNTALFSLLGTNYGGNGTTTFQLPNLQGRTPLHTSSSVPLGTFGGLEAVTLTTANLPSHQHSLLVSGDFATASVPGLATPAAKPRGGADIYVSSLATTTPLNPAAVANTGGGQPHTNMQPYLTLNFIIALQGIFPARN